MDGERDGARRSKDERGDDMIAKILESLVPSLEDPMLNAFLTCPSVRPAETNVQESTLLFGELNSARPRLASVLPSLPSDQKLSQPLL